MPVINGNYYMNPAYGRHIELGKQPSLARELKKEANQPRNIPADEEHLLDLIPRKDEKKK